MPPIASTGKPQLWHFTCDHGLTGIRKMGFVYPNPHVLIPELGQIAWFTDDPNPERDAVGLTSSMLTCDRLAYRFRVTDPWAARPWLEERHRVSADVLHDLESFSAPDTWWISNAPVPVVFAPAEVRAA